MPSAHRHGQGQGERAHTHRQAGPHCPRSAVPLARSVLAVRINDFYMGVRVGERGALPGRDFALTDWPLFPRRVPSLRYFQASFPFCGLAVDFSPGSLASHRITIACMQDSLG